MDKIIEGFYKLLLVVYFLIEKLGFFGAFFLILFIFSLVVIYLIIEDSDRIEKLKSNVFYPFFKFFKFFPNKYIASEISSQITAFLNKEVIKKIPNSPKVKVKIRWVINPDDPIFKKNGVLILRLKHDDDQTKNVLSAGLMVIQQTTCSYIRENIDTNILKAIDLSLLTKLANKLGNHGKVVNKKFFLDPELSNEKLISDLYSKIIEVDKGGYFIPIFINELEIAGEGIYSSGDYSDKSRDVVSLLDYLLTVAKRKVGTQIKLSFVNMTFNFGIILLAKTAKQESQGLVPYINSLNVHLRKGAQHIYIVSFPPAKSFFKKFIDHLKKDKRLNLQLLSTNSSLEITQDYTKKTEISIAFLTKDEVHYDSNFNNVIDELGILKDSILEGVVVDISIDFAVVKVNDFDCYITVDECSWYRVDSCSDSLSMGDVLNFKVIEIDYSIGSVLLSRKLDENDPWKQNEVPEIGDKIDVEITNVLQASFKGVLENGLEAYIPKREISWIELPEDELLQYVGKKFNMIVTDKVDSERALVCSLRDLEPDPWKNIHKEYFVGRELNGKIIEINEFNVLLDIGNNLTGRIPSIYLKESGYEFADYMNNLVIGQGLEVFVSKVFLGRKYIRLNLTRNKSKRGENKAITVKKKNKNK
ncbi:MAG: S1 RNA-binding domain-containing protein [Ignavibacteriae bacterium]|nr:S1 RNA-binding domain-containing protein [Ignavibacteriota bacterium]MCB9243081.1 S1 RNA-binding domain-containing protein [Ignavibacteriales bacterium]